MRIGIKIGNEEIFIYDSICEVLIKFERLGIKLIEVFHGDIPGKSAYINREYGITVIYDKESKNVEHVIINWDITFREKTDAFSKYKIKGIIEDDKGKIIYRINHRLYTKDLERYNGKIDGYIDSWLCTGKCKKQRNSRGCGHSRTSKVCLNCDNLGSSKTGYELKDDKNNGKRLVISECNENGRMYDIDICTM